MGNSHALHLAEEQRFFGSRPQALALRQKLESMLDDHAHVTIDFAGRSATQSFLDELVGILVLTHGGNVLKRLSFRGCNDDVQALIKFVVHDRLADKAARQTTH